MKTWINMIYCFNEKTYGLTIFECQTVDPDFGTKHHKRFNSGNISQSKLWSETYKWTIPDEDMFWYLKMAFNLQQYQKVRVSQKFVASWVHQMSSAAHQVIEISPPMMFSFKIWLCCLECFTLIISKKALILRYLSFHIIPTINTRMTEGIAINSAKRVYVRFLFHRNCL